MKAVILAAGVGSRLGNMAKSVPKCLLEIGGKEIVKHQISALRANNVRDISIVLGFYAEKVMGILKNDGVKFYLNKDYKITGMLESLFCAENEMNDDVLLLYGDVVIKADLIKKLIKDKNDICLVVDREKDIVHGSENKFEEYHGRQIKKGSTKVNIVDGMVKKISKDLSPEETSAEYIGIAKFSKNAIEIVRDKITELVRTGSIKAFPSPSYLFKWLMDNNHGINVVYTDDLVYEEVDYPEDMAKAKEKFS